MKSQAIIYVNIMYYIILEFLGRGIFNKKFLNLNTYNKIIRESMIITTFVFILFMNQTLKMSDFKLSGGTLLLMLIFGIFILYVIFLRQNNLLLIYFKPIFFAPIIEEIICRKLILDNINNMLLAISVSTLVFTLLHFPTRFIQWIYFFIIGILFSLIQIKTNNLFNVILLHSIINLSILISRKHNEHVSKLDSYKWTI